MNFDSRVLQTGEFDSGLQKGEFGLQKGEFDLQKGEFDLQIKGIKFGMQSLYNWLVRKKKH